MQQIFANLIESYQYLYRVLILNMGCHGYPTVKIHGTCPKRLVKGPYEPAYIGTVLVGFRFPQEWLGISRGESLPGSKATEPFKGEGKNTDALLQRRWLGNLEGEKPPKKLMEVCFNFMHMMFQVSTIDYI